MHETKRVSTGIAGIDDLIEGGIPRPFNLLIAGETGSGATTLSLQIAYNQLKADLPAIIVHWDRTGEEIQRAMYHYGWATEPYLNRKLFLLDPFGGEAVDTMRMFARADLEPMDKEKKPDMKKVWTHIDELFRGKDIHNSILVMDSLTFLLNSFPPGKLIFLSNMLRRTLAKLRMINISVIHRGAQPKIVETVMETLADGIISLEVDKDNFERVLKVKKFSNTKHSIRSLPYEITRKGIVLKPRSI